MTDHSEGDLPTPETTTYVASRISEALVMMRRDLAELRGLHAWCCGCPDCAVVR
jgi:hypothetical protein